MNQRLIHLTRRRERLVAKTVEQRTAFKAMLQPLHKPLGIVDQVLEKVHYLRSHPLWALVPLAGSLGYLLLRRGRFMPKILIAGALIQRIKRWAYLYQVAQPYWRQFLASRNLAKNTATTRHQ